jgi:hypothetical protein
MRFKIDTEKIKKFLEKLAITLIEKGFLILVLIFFISTILGFLIFLKYANPSPLEGEGKLIEFDEKTYNKVLEKWQEREKRFREVDFKEYPNPFK